MGRMKSSTGTLLAIGGMVCGILPVFLFGALSVQIGDEYGFGAHHIGLQVAAFYVTCTLASRSAGRFVHRVGSLAGLQWSTSIAGLTLFGIAGLSLISWYFITGLLVIAALGNTIAQVATTVVIARFVPEERQGLAFGLRQAARPIALFVGGLAVPLIAIAYSWRLAFILAGLFAFYLYWMARRLAHADTRPQARPGETAGDGTGVDAATVDP